MANSYEDIKSLTTVELVSDFLDCDDLLDQIGDEYDLDEESVRGLRQLERDYDTLLAEIRRRDMLFKVPTTSTHRVDCENASEWSCLDLVPVCQSLEGILDENWCEYYLNGSRPDTDLVEGEALVMSEIRRRDEVLGIPLPTPTPRREEETFSDDYGEEEVPF